MNAEPTPMQALLQTLPQRGYVAWIGVRPARREPPVAVTEVQACAGSGLSGDRYRGTRSNTREVTLIQAEHLVAIGSMLGREAVDPAQMRRNIVVAGINLLALKGRRFRIGEAVLEMTGHCHPCSRMEETFGPGGYNAVRGHGGITARIVSSGRIARGDPVAVVEDEDA